MSSPDCHADGAEGSVPAKGLRPSPTSETPTAPGPSSRIVALSLSLHALMFLVGLALLLLARWLQSLNKGMLAARDGVESTADPLRTLLQQHVNGAGATVLAMSLLAALVTWWQVRWVPPDDVSRRWRRQYRLAPPPAHGRVIERSCVLMWGYGYAWAVVGAMLAAGVAFHFVPDLYANVSATSTTAPFLLIMRWTPRAIVLLMAVFGLPVAWLLWADRSRLHRMESWLDQGVPVCLACGYPLRGLDSPACPECGADWSQWYPSKDGRPVLPTEKDGRPVRPT